jgi:hypothetical protein
MCHSSSKPCLVVEEPGLVFEEMCHGSSEPCLGFEEMCHSSSEPCLVVEELGGGGWITPPGGG